MIIDFDRQGERQMILDKLKELRGRQRVSITKYRPRRSDRQNRYYFPCFVKVFGEYLREQGNDHVSDEDVHEFFKDQLTSLPIYKYVEKNATFFAFLTALFATIMSLYYSDIVGYAPCKLCWLQRIFIYPQVILFFIAWRIKDANIWRYSLPISMFGALIGLYHLYLQFGGNPLIPCAAPGPGAVSCTQQFVMEFGFVSIPVMSLTCFGIMIALMIVQKRSAK
jgi:disulfide bond formation protein DsbB